MGGRDLKHSIHFQPLGIRVPIEKGKPLIEAARHLPALGRLSMEFPCGGHGLCGQCRVKLLEGDMGALTGSEEDLLTSDERQRGYRLACQAIPTSSVEIYIPPSSLAGKPELVVEGHEPTVSLDPRVKRVRVKVRRSTIEHPRSLWDQIEAALRPDPASAGPRVDLDLIRRQPALAAEGDVTVTVRQDRVTNAYVTGKAPRPLGLAVDLGTTKVAGFLIDLENGRTVASEGTVNPQVCYGDDIMTRLAYAMEGDEPYGRIKDLQRQGLSVMVDSLVAAAGASPEEIEYVVIAGNTAMQHLTLGLPVDQLARAPYVPAISGSVRVKAQSLGLRLSPGAEVYFLPSIGGFVGGDHAAMILASRIHESHEVVLGLDIGTNTEIVLRAGHRLLSCSCPSGPVFEGAHISHGMKAVEGAVCGLRLEGAEVTLETIGRKRALGLCGSGVVDATWELVREGIVNANGVMNSRSPRVRRNEETGIAEFVLAEPHETGHNQCLVLTQADISEIQLAKAAVASGIQILLDRAGVSERAIRRVIVAGAFGNRLNLSSAMGIGMLPHVPEGRFEPVGNAAGTGARLVLLSERERETAENIAREVEYVELTAEPDFANIFADALRFPPRKIMNA
ncbi:MAG: ASKHA domain-containing protein [Deltaproteobacteria bacterium]